MALWRSAVQCSPSRGTKNWATAGHVVHVVHVVNGQWAALRTAGAARKARKAPAHPGVLS